jgi:hypothetical protein
MKKGHNKQAFQPIEKRSQFHTGTKPNSPLKEKIKSEGVGEKRMQQYK